MRMKLMQVVLLATVGTTACSATTSSRNIRTAGLVALIDITAERADESVVSAGVVVGGEHSNTHVVLEGGDRLYAESAGERREMNTVGNGSYEAKFSHVDGDFVVSLTRENGDVPAPRSIGTMPASFEFTHKQEGPISRANDNMTLSWTPGGTDAQVSIELEGDCIHSEQYELGGDPGTFTLEPGKLNAWKSQEKESCSVVVHVVLARKGTPDPALDSDSSVQLRQIRETRFVSAP
jgi:hypothetical protein